MTNTGTTAPALLPVGTIVTYSDICNPGLVGVVVEHHGTPWTLYGVKWEGSEIVEPHNLRGPRFGFVLPVSA